MKEHPPDRDLCSFEPILRFRPPSVGVPKSEPDKEEAAGKKTGIPRAYMKI